MLEIDLPVDPQREFRSGSSVGKRTQLRRWHPRRRWWWCSGWSDPDVHGHSHHPHTSIDLLRVRLNLIISNPDLRIRINDTHPNKSHEEQGNDPRHSSNRRGVLSRKFPKGLITKPRCWYFVRSLPNHFLNFSSNYWETPGVFPFHKMQTNLNVGVWKPQLQLRGISDVSVLPTALKQNNELFLV